MPFLRLWHTPLPRSLQVQFYEHIQFYEFYEHILYIYMFYEQLESLVASVSPHDQLLILGDLNAFSGTDRTGFESVIGD